MLMIVRCISTKRKAGLCVMLVLPLLAYVVGAKSVFSGNGVGAQPPASTLKTEPHNQLIAVDIRGQVPGNPANGIEDLKKIFFYINIYRSKNNGYYPPSDREVLLAALSLPENRNLEGFDKVTSELANPDSQYADSPAVRQWHDRISPYVISDKRPDGRLIGGAKQPKTHDVLAYTNIYYHANGQKSRDGNAPNPVGFYLVLWDDGEVSQIAYDQLLHVPFGGGNEFSVAFPGQAGVPSECLTYQEHWPRSDNAVGPPLGKPISVGKDKPVKDNGGPESVIALSRLVNTPKDREKMWQVISPAQAEFTLEDVQQGAAKLGLNLQLKRLTLDELEKQGSPAILYLRDASRLVTLASLDDKQAIVLDQGMTRIVSRDVLARRYGGQALVPAVAAGAGPRASVDDAVRQLDLKSTEEEVTQQVVITNTGQQPLTLQLEHPIPGCTKAELSSNAVAPGAKATLNLTLKWRSVLKGETQNVFVMLKTNDPLRPRLQLGFELRAPKP